MPRRLTSQAAPRHTVNTAGWRGCRCWCGRSAPVLHAERVCTPLLHVFTTCPRRRVRSSLAELADFFSRFRRSLLEGAGRSSRRRLSREQLSFNHPVCCCSGRIFTRKEVSSVIYTASASRRNDRSQTNGSVRATGDVGMTGAVH